MLRALDIRDILIIDRLELGFQPGLNVLTGETGAGKSILLDCLGFVLGWRGRADLVRQGAAQGEVTAVFELGPDHPARAVLEDAGVPHEEDELILRRVNTRDGRKTAWVNDRRTSGDVLRTLSSYLVELHGQHDDRGLLDARGHRSLLDAYGRLDDKLAAVALAWKALREARAARDAAAARLAAVQADEETLRHNADELAKLDPQAGEEAELDTLRRRMQGAEQVLGDLHRAIEALGSDGAEGALAQAVRWIEGASEGLSGLGERSLAALDRALTEMGEAQDGLAEALDTLQFEPQELDRVTDRLFSLRELARKHKVQPDDLPDLARELTALVAALEGGAEDLASHERAVAEAGAAYDVAAGTLSGARKEAAERLDAAVMAELAPLRMERAVFTTEITDGPEGRGWSGRGGVSRGDQSGGAERPAGEDRVGRGAVAVPSGAQGLSDDGQHRAHTDF